VRIGVHHGLIGHPLKTVRFRTVRPSKTEMGNPFNYFTLTFLADFWPTSGRLLADIVLLHRNALSQIAWLIDI
jgi:hypothetical protein